MLKRLLVFTLLLLFLAPVYANSATYDPEPIKEIKIEDTNLGNRITNSVNDGHIPYVTLDEATNWLDRKGYEVIALLQKISQPFAIIMFIVGAFTVLIGAVSGSRLSGRGLWGMTIAVIIYTVSIYAVELVQIMSNWLSN